METKKKKGVITEDDVSLLLQRYSATTILALLQEIGQLSGVKIDWNALAKRTSTGISCPREYQMLWRHLAYRHSLEEKLEVDAELLDDDSDLEFELEAFPPVSSEASAEAAACVKVLMSSGLPKDPNTVNRPTVEAPLTINIPNRQSPNDRSDKPHASATPNGLNIMIPVSVHKQHLPSAIPIDSLDGNGTTSSKQPSKKKRKLWTPEEDRELIAAVMKFGEGNWQNILKEDFKHDRTAPQLSQRWSILKKNMGKTNAGSNGNANISTRNENVFLTNQAMSVALNMPTIGSLSSIRTGPMQSSSATNSVFTAASTELSPLLNQKVPSQPQEMTSQKGLILAISKPRVIPTKPSGPVKLSTGPNPLIQKAAFAAGGRIANPSTAASLFKAAQSRNAVHIRPGGALAMSQAPVTKPSPSAIISTPNSSNVVQTRLSSPAVPVSGSGTGRSQAAAIVSKLCGQTAPSTATLSQSGESKSGSNACKSIDEDDGKSTATISAGIVVSVLSKEGVEVAGQLKSTEGDDGRNDLANATVDVPVLPKELKVSFPLKFAIGSDGKSNVATPADVSIPSKAEVEVAVRSTSTDGGDGKSTSTVPVDSVSEQSNEVIEVTPKSNIDSFAGGDQNCVVDLDMDTDDAVKHISDNKPIVDECLTKKSVCHIDKDEVASMDVDASETSEQVVANHLQTQAHLEPSELVPQHVEAPVDMDTSDTSKAVPVDMDTSDTSKASSDN